MRILKFIVKGQEIIRDPACDFSGLVAGTEGYLKARFDFDKDWDGCKKVASFWKNRKEYAAPVINGECEIPAEALTWNAFKISVTGIRQGYKIITNQIEITQKRRG